MGGESKVSSYVQYVLFSAVCFLMVKVCLLLVDQWYFQKGIFGRGSFLAADIAKYQHMLSLLAPKRKMVLSVPAAWVK